MELHITNIDIPLGGDILLFCKGELICFLLKKKERKRNAQNGCQHVFFALCVQAGAEGEITWKKDNEDFDDEEKVEKVDESNSLVKIKNASMQDAGKYTCTCEFDSGHTDHVDIWLYIYGM